MSDTDITDLDSESESGQAWAASLFARQPAVTPRRDDPADTATSQGSGPADDRGSSTPGLGGGGRPEPIDLSELAKIGRADSGPTAPGDDAARPVDQGKVWATVLVVIIAVFSVITGSLMWFTSNDDPAPSQTVDVPALAVGAPTVEPTPAPEAGDDVIPYMASGDPEKTGCYDGSTSPGALQETDTESAWVCVRGFGSAGGGTNGQILPITLGNQMTGPRWYMVSKVEITPGWVPKIQGGRDEWSQHRVPTRVRFSFNDSSDPLRPPTVWDVDTRGARGPVTFVAPKPVLAVSITMVILETERPAALDPTTSDAAPTSTPLFPASPTTSSDPTDDPAKPTAVDATFAISLLRFEGRQP